MVCSSFVIGCMRIRDRRMGKVCVYDAGVLLDCVFQTPILQFAVCHFHNALRSSITPAVFVVCVRMFHETLKNLFTHKETAHKTSQRADGHALDSVGN